ncbi:hypothetical protein J6590_035550 [Homalodisca vitripennis]|nr:hypothetical protein J6590_035550 [Homalodisca vitripennis]
MILHSTCNCLKEPAARPLRASRRVPNFANSLLTRRPSDRRQQRWGSVGTISHGVRGERVNRPRRVVSKGGWKWKTGYKTADPSTAVKVLLSEGKSSAEAPSGEFVVTDIFLFTSCQKLPLEMTSPRSNRLQFTDSVRITV